jgi:hypothetical protein
LLVLERVVSVYQKYKKYRPVTIRNVALMTSEATWRFALSRKDWRPMRTIDKATTKIRVS